MEPFIDMAVFNRRKPEKSNQSTNQPKAPPTIKQRKKKKPTTMQAPHKQLLCVKHHVISAVLHMNDLLKNYFNKTGQSYHPASVSL